MVLLQWQFSIINASENTWLHVCFVLFPLLSGFVFIHIPLCQNLNKLFTLLTNWKGHLIKSRSLLWLSYLNCNTIELRISNTCKWATTHPQSILQLKNKNFRFINNNFSLSEQHFQFRIVQNSLITILEFYSVTTVDGYDYECSNKFEFHNLP